ncbi:nitrite reductase small subunit NirD [Actinophytocola sediminis]
MTSATVVCELTELLPDRGAAALLPDGEQVAVFRTAVGEVFALSNIDPYSRAAVLSRGIVGDLRGVPVVASPMHKQHFELRTGECVEDRAVTVRVYQVRVEAGRVVVESP